MTSFSRFFSIFVALVGLVGGLAAALYVQLSSDDSAPAQAAPVDYRPEATVSQAATAVMEERTDVQVTAVLARPLFDPRRRPPMAGSAVSPTAGLPRLTGVIVGTFGRRAIFAGPPGGRSLVVQEGEQIEAYVVQSIGPGETVVLGPEGRRVLHPAFDPNGQSALGNPDGATGLTLLPDQAQGMLQLASPMLRPGR